MGGSFACPQTVRQEDKKPVDALAASCTACLKASVMLAVRAGAGSTCRDGHSDTVHCAVLRHCCQPRCSRAHLHEGLCDALDSALRPVPVLVNKITEVGLQPV